MSLQFFKHFFKQFKVLSIRYGDILSLVHRALGTKFRNKRVEASGIKPYVFPHHKRIRFLLVKRLICFWKISLLIPLFVFTTACGSKGTTENNINRIITKEGLKNMKIALELYKKEYGEYPNSLSEFLERKGIKDKSLIQDAWGRPYFYTRRDSNYEIFSVGRDKKPFTKDDVHPPR